MSNHVKSIGRQSRIGLPCYSCYYICPFDIFLDSKGLPNLQSTTLQVTMWVAAAFVDSASVSLYRLFTCFTEIAFTNNHHMFGELLPVSLIYIIDK